MNKGLKILRYLYEDTKNNPNRTYHNISFLLYSKDIYAIAYKRICLNLSAKGYNYDIDKRIISDLIDILKKKEYKFTSTLNITPERNYKISRELLMDYILLEAIYLVLKSIYSFSIFSNEYKAWSICNPNKFIHKLIKQLPSSYWGIKSIVNKTFTKEDHSNLLVQIAQKISDPFFLNLLEKILYMDYLNSKSKYHSLSKVIEIPGSQLFYLLIDIAYSQLDCLIQSNILTLYIQKINCNQKDNRNISQIWQKRKYNQKLLFQKQNFKNILIYYVRYGYTIILLVKDPLKHSHMVDLNNFILNQIRQFNKVDQNIYNSQIFQPNKESLNLLSYKIFVNSKQVYIQIEAKKIIDLLIKYNFITYNKQNKIRPISQNKLLSYRDHQILESYQYIWSCFLEYYSGLSDYSYLQYIGILLKYSFFMTLSHKHKTTLSKIFSSYQKKEVNVFSFKSKSLKSKSLDFKEFNYVPDPFKYYY